MKSAKSSTDKSFLRVFFHDKKIRCLWSNEILRIDFEETIIEAMETEKRWREKSKVVSQSPQSRIAIIFEIFIMKCQNFRKPDSIWTKKATTRLSILKWPSDCALFERFSCLCSYLKWFESYDIKWFFLHSRFGKRSRPWT